MHIRFGFIRLYLEGCQDEKLFWVVMDRERRFGVVMGKKRRWLGC